MRIAVLGAGNVGTALATAAVRAGHDVRITASMPEHAATAATATGATAVDSNSEAVRGVDLVVLAVPGRETSTVATEITGHLLGLVVVDATNPLAETGGDLSLTGISGAADIQARISDAVVVKAFNTIFAARYAAPAEDGQPLDVLIAGDDADAKAVVAAFAASLGFRALDVGGMRFARSLEEMALVNIAMNAANGWPWRSAWRLVGARTGQSTGSKRRRSTSTSSTGIPRTGWWPSSRMTPRSTPRWRTWRDAGVELPEVNVLSGPEGARLLDRRGARHGVGARVLRVLQLGGAFEGETLRQHARALEAGQSVVFVPVAGDEEEGRVADILRGRGGMQLLRYHRWTIDQLPGQLPESAP